MNESITATSVSLASVMYISIFSYEISASTLIQCSSLRVGQCGQVVLINGSMSVVSAA